MMRRAAVLLAALGLLLSFAPAVHADSDVKTAKDCAEYALPSLDPPDYVCLQLTYQNNISGSIGVRIIAIRIWLPYPDAFESNAITCTNLRAWNAAGDVKWRRDGAECDLKKSSPSKTFTPNLDLNGATAVTVSWHFDANLDAQRDHDDQYLHVTVSG